MADNTTLDAGSGGDTFGTDDIAGVKYPRSKIIIGADGTNDGDVSAANPLPVKGTGTAGTANAGVVTVQGIAAMTPLLVTAQAGTANIGDVDVLTVPADPFGANADAASATGSISAKLRFIAGTGIPVTGTVTVGSHAVTNAGTFVIQENGSALSALQLIDDPVFVDNAAFTATTSKVMMIGGIYQASPTTLTDGRAGAVLLDDKHRIVLAPGTAEKTDDALFSPGATTVVMIGFEADEGSTDSVDEGDAGAARMTLDRKQIVTLQPHTSGGLSTFMASGSDGSTILVATAQTVKASAGQLYGYYLYNPESAVTFVHFYNAIGVSVGTTNPLFTLAIPPTSAANLMFPNGVTFSNAGGWSIAATTTAGGNTAPTTGVSAVLWYM